MNHVTYILEINLKADIWSKCIAHTHIHTYIVNNAYKHIIRYINVNSM